MIDEFFLECGLCHVVMSEAVGYWSCMADSPHYDGEYVESGGKRYERVVEGVCPGCGEQNFPMRLVQMS